MLLFLRLFQLQFFPSSHLQIKLLFLIEGKIDLRLHKPNLHGAITLPEFHEKDTAREFTNSNGLGPKTETNEKLSTNAKTNTNAINW